MASKSPRSLPAEYASGGTIPQPTWCGDCGIGLYPLVAIVVPTASSLPSCEWNQGLSGPCAGVVRFGTRVVIRPPSGITARRFPPSGGAFFLQDCPERVFVHAGQLFQFSGTSFHLNAVCRA